MLFYLGPRIGFIVLVLAGVAPTLPVIILSPICNSSDIISVSVAVDNPFLNGITITLMELIGMKVEEKMEYLDFTAKIGIKMWTKKMEIMII